MSETQVLYKLLNLKEQEKQEAELNKKAALETFETAATKLYSELKTKEEAEIAFEKKSVKQMTIERMKQQFSYISHKNQEIAALQTEVQRARTAMTKKQEMFTTAYREVKKLEKLIGIRERKQKQKRQKAEDKLMDEIAIRQFFEANTN